MKKLSAETFDFIINPTYYKIKDKLPIILEEWIKVYGEEYRSVITEKFNKINYVMFTKTRNLVDYANSLKHYIFNTINEEFYRSLGYNMNCFDPYIFAQLDGVYNRELMNIYMDNNMFNLNENEMLNLLNTKIKSFLNTKLTDLKTSGKIEKANLIENSLRVLDELMNNYGTFYRRYKNTFDKLSQYNLTMQNEQKRLIHEEIRDSICELLPAQDVKYIKSDEEFKIDFLESSYLFFKQTKYSDETLLEIGDINCFNSEYTNQYLDGKLDEHVCDYLIKERKRFFGHLGIDNSNIDVMDSKACFEKLKTLFNDSFNFASIDSYILKLQTKIDEVNKKYRENEKFLAFTTDDEQIISNILSTELLSRSQNQNYSHTTSWSEEEIKKYSKDLTTDIKHIENKCFFSILFSTPNVKNTEVPYIFFQPVFPGGSLQTNIDECLIHEIGHAITYNNYDYAKQTYNVGFDLTGKERKYSCLNELINQYLTLKIRDNLHNNNVYLKDNKDWLNTNTIMYTEFMFLLEPFEEYMSYFKKASIESNIGYIEHIFGKTIFQKYNDLVNNVFNEALKVLPYSLLKTSPEYYNYVKEELQKIQNEVQQNNLEMIKTR